MQEITVSPLPPNDVIFGWFTSSSLSVSKPISTNTRPPRTRRHPCIFPRLFFIIIVYVRPLSQVVLGMFYLIWRERGERERERGGKENRAITYCVRVTRRDAEPHKNLDKKAPATNAGLPPFFPPLSRVH